MIDDKRRKEISRTLFDSVVVSLSQSAGQSGSYEKIKFLIGQSAVAIRIAEASAPLDTITFAFNLKKYAIFESIKNIINYHSFEPVSMNIDTIILWNETLFIKNEKYSDFYVSIYSSLRSSILRFCTEYLQEDEVFALQKETNSSDFLVVALLANLENSTKTKDASDHKNNFLSLYSSISQSCITTENTFVFKNSLLNSVVLDKESVYSSFYKNSNSVIPIEIKISKDANATGWKVDSSPVDIKTGYLINQRGNLYRITNYDSTSKQLTLNNYYDLRETYSSIINRGGTDENKTILITNTGGASFESPVNNTILINDKNYIQIKLKKGTQEKTFIHTFSGFDPVSVSLTKGTDENQQDVWFFNHATIIPEEGYILYQKSYTYIVSSYDSLTKKITFNSYANLQNSDEILNPTKIQKTISSARGLVREITSPSNNTICSGNGKDFSISFKSEQITGASGAETLRSIFFSTEPFYYGDDVEVDFIVAGHTSLASLFPTKIKGRNKVIYSYPSSHSVYLENYNSLFDKIKKDIDFYITLKALRSIEEEEDEFSLDSSNQRVLTYIPPDYEEMFKIDFEDEEFSAIKDALTKKRQFSNLNDFPKSPKWKSKGFKDIVGASKLAKLQSSLSSIEGKFKKVEAVLNGVESFVNTLSVLAEDGTSLIGQVANSAADAIDKIIGNFASTGVYFLDMYNYSRSYSVAIKDRDENAPDNESTVKKSYLYDFASDSLIDGDDINDINYNSKNGQDEKNESSLKNYYEWAPFRPITYSEFISTIANAFLDPNDIPDRRTIQQTVGQRDSKLKNIPIRPGAPQWSQGSKSVVFVVAFVAPSFSELSAFLGLFEKLKKSFEKAKENVKESFGNFNYSKALDEIKNSDMSKDLKELYSESLIKRAISEAQGVVKGGTYPDFYGVTLESMHPLMTEFFNILRRLPIMLRAGGEAIEQSFSESFNDVLEQSQTAIDWLKQTLSLVRTIVSFISSLQQLNASVLKITSTGGVYDIYDQLMSASGFPDEDNDVPRWIFGAVLAAGAPDIAGTQDMLFNYGSQIKESSIEINEFAKDSKKELKRALNESKNKPDDGGVGGLEKFGNILG